MMQYTNCVVKSHKVQTVKLTLGPCTKILIKRPMRNKLDYKRSLLVTVEKSKILMES